MAVHKKANKDYQALEKTNIESPVQTKVPTHLVRSKIVYIECVVRLTPYWNMSERDHCSSIRRALMTLFRTLFAGNLGDINYSS